LSKHISIAENLLIVSDILKIVMGPIPKRKTERAPPVDKLWKPAGGVGLALLAYFIIQGFQVEIPRVDVSDELALREVFFGEGIGKNYAVLCHDESSSIPVSSVFQDAKSDGTAPAEFVLVNCNHILPDSGKTVAQRFELDVKKRPTIFISGKSGPPKQIPEKHLKTGNMLIKALKYNLEPRTAKIENTKMLKQKCLNADMCALFLKGGTPDKNVKESIQNLIVSYPNIQFASIDSSVLMLTNLEEHLPMYTKGQHRFIMFKKISGTLDAPPEKNTQDGESADTPKSSGRLITSVAGFEGKSMSYSSLSSFVNGVVSGSIETNKIPALPVVKTRTKKAEEQERQKRQRTQQRAQDKNAQNQQSTGNRFQEGSKEARKAERDKRRADHHKENDVKPLTPEQIAERERQRRLRMEEEAAKWNMMPDDAPEEGDPVEEEYDIGLEDFDEDEGFVDINADEDREEDDEDVMDLD